MVDRIRDDAEFRERVRTSFELKVPLTAFLGRIAGDGEPYWTAHDRDVAVAWMRWTDSLHTCGVPRDIAFDANNELRDVDGLPAYRWQGEVNHCHVCAAADRARRIYDRAGDDPDVEVNRDGLVVLITDLDG